MARPTSPQITTFHASGPADLVTTLDRSEFTGGVDYRWRDRPPGNRLVEYFGTHEIAPLGMETSNCLILLIPQRLTSQPAAAPATRHNYCVKAWLQPVL